MSFDTNISANGTWLRSLATWLAIASLVLVLVNAMLVLRNQGVQRIVNQRQQVINQAPQLARAGQILVQTTARVSVANKDETLTAVLEHQGIKVSTTPPPGAKP